MTEEKVLAPRPEKEPIDIQPKRDEENLYLEVARVEFDEDLSSVVERFQKVRETELETRNSFAFQHNGDDLRVETIARQYNASKPTDKIKTKKTNYLLYVRDKAGKVIAYRDGYLTDIEDNSEVGAGGIIRTRERGKGFGSIVEMANQAFLQSEAVRRGKTVRWRVNDRNSQDMQQLQEVSQRSDNPMIKLLSEIKTNEERKRWESIYGTNAQAKLGLSNGEKVFESTPSANFPFAPDSEVQLERVGNSLVPQIIEVNQKSERQTPDTQISDLRTAVENVQPELLTSQQYLEKLLQD